MGLVPVENAVMAPFDCRHINKVDPGADRLSRMPYVEKRGVPHPLDTPLRLPDHDAVLACHKVALDSVLREAVHVP